MSSAHSEHNSLHGTQWSSRCKMIESIITDTIEEQNLRPYSESIYYTLNEYIKTIYFEHHKSNTEQEMGQMILMNMHKYIASLNRINITQPQEAFPNSINDSIEALQQQRSHTIQKQYEDKQLQLKTDFMPNVPEQIDFSDKNVSTYTEDTNMLLQNEIENRKHSVPIQDTMFPVEYIWVLPKFIQWNENVCVIELNLPNLCDHFTVTNMFFEYTTLPKNSDYIKVESEMKQSWFFRNRGNILQFQGYLHVRAKQSKIKIYFEQDSEFDYKSLEILHTQIMIFN